MAKLLLKGAAPSEPQVVFELAQDGDCISLRATVGGEMNTILCIAPNGSVHRHVLSNSFVQASGFEVTVRSRLRDETP